MKHLVTVGVLVMMTFLTSCDKENSNRNDDLDGTWQLSSLEGGGSNEFAIINGIALPVGFSMNGCDLDYTIRFDEDASRFSTNGSYGIKYNSAVMNDSTVHTVLHDDYQVSSNYNEDSNQLTSDRAVLQFKIASAIGEQAIEVLNATIVELTDETLVLQHKETLSDQQPGGTLFTTVDVITTWTKK